MRPQGGGTPFHPPQSPVDIPDHLRHGSSYVHRHYGCRCVDCQEWRRGYDRKRDQEIRKGQWPITRQGWYVCIGKWGVTRADHLYVNDVCDTCGADRAAEEYWEQRWKESE